MIDALLPPDTDTRKPEEFERYARLMKARVHVEIVRKNMLTEVAEKRQKGLRPFRTVGIPAEMCG